MKLKTYTKILSTSIIFSLAFLVSSLNVYGEIGVKPMATIGFTNTQRNYNVDDNESDKDLPSYPTPFANLTVAAAGAGNITVTITYTTNNGTLENGDGIVGGFTGNAGEYSFTGLAADAQSALQALLFIPTNNQISSTPSPQTVITNFTIEIEEAGQLDATNNEVTVTATSINDAPLISGVSSSQVNDGLDGFNVQNTVNPFALIEITDPDFNEELQLEITYNENAGALNNATTFTGTPLAVQEYLRDLEFNPVDDVFTANTDVIFTINLKDKSAVAINGVGVFDATTEVEIIPQNDAPTITGIIINTAAFDNATDIFPFSNATITDNDEQGDQNVTVLIELNDPDNGILDDLPAGSTGDATNGYSFSGTPSQLTTQIRDITFNPDDNEISIGDTETTIFTVTVDDGIFTPLPSSDVSVLVKPFNDAPTFVNSPAPFYTVNENNSNPQNPIFSFDADASDVDFGSPALIYALEGEYNGIAFNENSLPDWLEFDDETGLLEGTPEDGDDGFYTITISVSDGVNEKVSLPAFPIIVNPVNSAPSFNLSPTANTVNAEATGEVDINDILTYSGNTNNDPNQAIKVEDILLEVDVNSDNPNLFESLAIRPKNNFEANVDARNDLVIDYEIAAGETGTAVVRVTVIDNGSSENSTTREFQINVLEDNNAPVIPNLPTYEVNEDEPNANAREIVIEGITPGDADQGINSVTVSVSPATPNIIKGNPSAVFTEITNGPNKDTYRVTINYELEEDAFGSAILILTVEDNSNLISSNRFSTVNVNITVNPVDDAPVILRQEGQRTGISEGASFTLILDDFVIEHPPNEENVLGEELELVVQNGNGYTHEDNEVTVNNGFGEGELTVNVTIREKADTDVGGVKDVKGEYKVNISDINDPPVIRGQNPNPLLVSEDGSVLIELSNLIIDDDNSATTNLYITSIGVSVDGSYTIENGNEIIPKKDLVGIITVPVEVSDGVVNDEKFSNIYNVIIDVQPVNDPPLITDQFEVSIREEDSYEINIGDVKITDVDNEDEDFTLTVAEGLNYTIVDGTEIKANDNFFGTLTIPVQVNDGSANSNLFEFDIDVVPVNDAPTINVLANRTVGDDNGQTLFVNFSGVTAGLNETGQNLTITATSGNQSLIQTVDVIYTPNQSVGLLRMETIPERDGVTTITVTVQDDGGTDDGGVDSKVITFDVTVIGVNSAPTLDFISDINLLEDFEPTPVQLRNIRDGDDGGQEITITAVSSNPALIPNPIINYVQGETEGTLIYNPVPGQNGSANITVTVKDNGGTANGGEDTYQVAFEISVLGLNDRPTIDAVADTSLLEDTNALTLLLTGITDGDAESEQKMTISAISSRPEILPDPTVIYDSVSTTAELILTPALNISGTATITLTIKDDGGSLVAGQEDTRVINFEVTVLPVNDAPTINEITNTVRLLEGAETQRQLLTGITDGDSELIQSITSVTVNSNKPDFYESLEIAYREGDTNGELIFKADPDANGMDTLTITVTDNGGIENGGVNTTTTTVFVDILPLNDAPTINNPPNIDNILKNSEGDCITLSGISDGDPELEQAVVVTASSSRPDIIPDPVISEFKPESGTAQLCYELVPDARGLVEITLTLKDDGGLPGNDTRSIIFTIGVGFSIGVGVINNPPIIIGEDGQPLEEVNLTTSKDEPLDICFQVIDRDKDEVDLGEIIARNSDASGEIIPGSFTFKDDSLCFVYEAYPNTLSGEDWFEFTICDDVPGDIACDTIRMNIVILPSSELIVYDGISPTNPDGRNDAWFIEGIENYPENLVQIYSPTGELVYEVSSYDNRDNLWRGESNKGIVLGSRELPTGVYYYVIDLGDGASPPLKGSVIIK